MLGTKGGVKKGSPRFPVVAHDLGLKLRFQRLAINNNCSLFQWDGFYEAGFFDLQSVSISYYKGKSGGAKKGQE